MDILSPSSTLAVCSLSALVLGGAVGAWTAHRIARRHGRERERSLARRELALLDARREGADPTRPPDGTGAPDEDVLLHIAVRQVDEARGRADDLLAALDAQERRHALAVAGLELASVRARKRTQLALAVLAAYRTRADRASPDRRSGLAPAKRTRHERRTGERRTAGPDRRAPRPPIGDGVQAPPAPIETARHAHRRSS